MIYTDTLERQKIEIYDIDAETYAAAEKYLTTRATARKHARKNGHTWIAQITLNGEARGYLAIGDIVQYATHHDIKGGAIVGWHRPQAQELIGRRGKMLYLAI